MKILIIGIVANGKTTLTKGKASIKDYKKGN